MKKSKATKLWAIILIVVVILFGILILLKIIDKNKELDMTQISNIITEKGEQVRSKSEKIIADKLFMKGIPYVYEQPLYLKGYGYVMPDFKILNVKKRKEFYLEHFGMMDVEEYVRKALRKIETFEKNDIYPGEKLLMTFETSDSPINIKLLDEMVNRYLI